MTEFSDVKEAMDAIGGHLVGMTSGVEAAHSNLTALHETAKNDDEQDLLPLIEGALEEVAGLKAKFAKLEELYAANGSSIQSIAPTPPDGASEPGDDSGPGDQSVPGAASDDGGDDASA